MIDQGAVQIEENHICHRMIISWCMSLTPGGRYRDLPFGMVVQVVTTGRTSSDAALVGVEQRGFA